MKYEEKRGAIFFSSHVSLKSLSFSVFKSIFFQYGVWFLSLNFVVIFGEK